MTGFVFLFLLLRWGILHRVLLVTEWCHILCTKSVSFVWVFIIWNSIVLVLWWSSVLESVLPLQRLRTWSIYEEALWESLSVATMTCVLWMTFSFSSSTSQQLLRRTAPVSINWTPHSSKAETPAGPEEILLPLATIHPPIVWKPGLAAGIHPWVFRKPKSQTWLPLDLTHPQFAWKSRLLAGTQPQVFHKPNLQQILRRLKISMEISRLSIFPSLRW